MQEAEVLVEQGDLLQQVSVASMAGGMILMGIPISILYIVLFRIYAESEFILTYIYIIVIEKNLNVFPPKSLFAA